MTGLLHGQRGLVLGLSGPDSVGYACLRDLRSMGAEVAVTYRPERRSICGPLAEQAGCEQHYAVDATDDTQIVRALTDLGSAWGQLDFLVHTWAYVPPGLFSQPLLQVSGKDFHDVMEVGARSLLAVTSHAVTMLSKSDAPRIVALTSSAYRLSMPNYHVLGIAKAALVAAVRYLALELGPAGILCNALSFSLLPTAGAVRALGDETAGRTHAYLAKRAPTRTALTSEHVTNAVAYLASPYCANITGEVLTVDGGFSGTYFT